MNDLVQGLPPIVWYDSGAHGRVMVADSLSYFEHEPWLDDVVVGASFAGAPTGAMPMRPGVKAWIAHEGGPGKDEAGIGGLALAQRFGIPAAAIATMAARLSDGMSLIAGPVSRVNEAAKALGVVPGQTGGEAAKLMLKAPQGRPCDLKGVIDETIYEMEIVPDGRVLAVWSFTRVKGECPNDVFCVASHGGRVMAQYALRVKPRGLIANDAGRGLGDSGTDGLKLVDRLFNTPAATVSSESARIGDALSTYHDGIISAVNRCAATLGVSVGMKASDAARHLLLASPRRRQALDEA